MRAAVITLSLSTAGFFLLWLLDPRCSQETVHTPLSEAPCAPVVEAPAQPFVPSPAPAATSTTAPPAPAPEAGAEPLPSPAPMQSYAIESRISSIGKFVTLTDEQRERLREKYIRDGAAAKAGRQPDSESLDQILGQANAEFYRSELNRAIERSKEQELDRELFYLSRRLNLSEAQEKRMRQLLSTVDRAVKERFDPERAAAALDPGGRVKLMVRENEYRDSWLAEKAKEVLEPDQYQAYLQEQADSTAKDLGIWHAP